MDYVVSRRSGKGGLLVLPERRTRYIRFERLRSISQGAVVHRALRRLMNEKALPLLHTLTMNNGCKSLDQKPLERILRAPVYYAHSYVSWEKGSIEHANDLLRFWFPKGTDFSRVPLPHITTVQDRMNAISRIKL